MFDFAIVRAVMFNGGSSDKNGLEPILLDVVAGKVPSKRVLAGTLAAREGFVANSSYMVSIEEVEANEYGRQFRFKNLGSITGLELMKACRDLGAGKVIDVSEEEAVESFQNPEPEPQQAKKPASSKK